MIEYSNGNLHDINHFMKVWAYAKTIGELESLEKDTQYILEIAAITHDIACPLCREKYGNTNGKYQEIEGAILIKEFFKDDNFKLTPQQIDRVSYLIAHHHTFKDVEGIDYQILLEADYIVNADESSYSKNNIVNAKNTIFKTQSGIKLLESIYKV